MHLLAEQTATTVLQTYEAGLGLALCGSVRPHGDNKASACAILHEQQADI
jgi:hypothetical protein